MEISIFNYGSGYNGLSLNFFHLHQGQIIIGRSSTEASSLSAIVNRIEIKFGFFFSTFVELESQLGEIPEGWPLSQLWFKGCRLSLNFCNLCQG